MRGLWWYNNFKRHLNDWNAKRLLMKVWIKQGRDPAMFPKSAPITPEAAAWARDILRRL